MCNCRGTEDVEEETGGAVGKPSAALISKLYFLSFCFLWRKVEVVRGGNSNVIGARRPLVGLKEEKGSDDE